MFCARPITSNPGNFVLRAHSTSRVFANSTKNRRLRLLPGMHAWTLTLLRRPNGDQTRHIASGNIRRQRDLGGRSSLQTVWLLSAYWMKSFHNRNFRMCVATTRTAVRAPTSYEEGQL